jgi:hypothetical protein
VSLSLNSVTSRNTTGFFSVDSDWMSNLMMMAMQKEMKAFGMAIRAHQSTFSNNSKEFESASVLAQKSEAMVTTRRDEIDQQKIKKKMAADTIEWFEHLETKRRRHFLNRVHDRAESNKAIR